MKQIIHAADIHLSSQDEQYSFNILNEILSYAKDADVALIAGDLFDTFDDAIKLAPKFLSYIETLPKKVQVIVVAGNHDFLRNTGERYPLQSHDRLHVVADNPLIIKLDSIEYICLPHGHLPIELKKIVTQKESGAFRIIITHGTVADLVYTGIQEEEPSDTFSIQDFTCYNPNYVALGHIHSSCEYSENATTFVYPGSSKIFRKGETGKRSIYTLKVENTQCTREKIFLQNAGIWEEKIVTLYDGSYLSKIENILSKYSKNDYITLKLEGLIESENALLELERTLQQKVANKVIRKIDLNDKDLVRYESFLDNKSVKSFVTLWHEKSKELTQQFGEEATSRALSMGLTELKKILEARK